MLLIEVDFINRNAFWPQMPMLAYVQPVMAVALSTAATSRLAASHE